MTHIEVNNSNTVVSFSSIAALRSEHTKLLKMRSSFSNESAFFDAVRFFIQQGQETGRLLEATEERRVAQALLDYWVDVLPRTEYKPLDFPLHEFDPRSAFGLDVSAGPYRGLDTFQEKDRRLFYGREKLINFLVNQLAQDRFLALIGPSGSGKSSLMLAGLVPVLKDGALPGSQNWKYYERMVPGSDPLANLGRIVNTAPVDTDQWLNETHLIELVGNQCKAEGKEAAVIVVDQFEELFTLCKAKDQEAEERIRNSFVNNLRVLVKGIPLFAIKADFANELNSSQVSPELCAAFKEHDRCLTPQAKVVIEPTKSKWTIVAADTKYLVEQGKVNETLDVYLNQALKHTVILTMRNDFRSSITRLPIGFQRLFDQNCVRVTPLDPIELRAVIEKPAHLVGLEFEPGVVAALLGDILGERIATSEIPKDKVPLRNKYGESAPLPLLQFALSKLYENRSGNLITMDAYRKLGGAYGALAKSADDFYRTQLKSPEKQKAAQYILLQMLQVKDLEFTSHRVRYASFFDDNDKSLTPKIREQIGPVLKNLIVAKLLRLTKGDLAIDDQVEIAHETLIDNWPILHQWVEDKRNKLYRLKKYEDRARDWEARGNKGSKLDAVEMGELRHLKIDYDSDVISSKSFKNQIQTRWNDIMLRWVDDTNGDVVFSKQLKALIKASQQASTRQLVALVLSLLVVITFWVAMTLYAWEQKDVAERETRQARARELAGAAISNLETNPELSTLLAFKAASSTFDQDKTIPSEAEAALQRALQAAFLQHTFAGHTAAVFGIAYSPDGQRLATASADNTIKLWDTLSGIQVLTLTGHTDSVNSVTYSPDGQHLATASADKTVRLWDAISGTALLTLTGHTAAVNGVAFSPDDQRLATASVDKTVRLWDAVSGTVLLTLTGHTAAVNGVAFSPDGQRLATASVDRTVRLWDTVSGAAILTFTNDSAASVLKILSAAWGRLSGAQVGQALSVSVAYSPDGQRLAATSTDNAVKVWDIPSGTQVLTLTGHTGMVNGVAYSPDGQRLATASADKTVKVWNAATGAEMFTLSDHKLSVLQVVYSPDGLHLATASLDSTTKVWYVAPSQPVHTLKSHAGRVIDIAYSPNGEYLAMANADKTVRVRNVISETTLLTLTDHTDDVNSIAYSSDGARLATASTDKTAIVWDASSGQRLITLKGHEQAVNSVAFSPDGKHLATASTDQTARVWDTSSGSELFTLAGHKGPVWDIVYSSDGTLIATAGRDVRIWDAIVGTALLTLTGHTDTVLSVTFSRDGTLVATASADKTARVWDIHSGKVLLRLIGHAAAIEHLVFSPTGTRLATASKDGIVMVWDVTTGQELYTWLGRNLIYRPDGNYLATAGNDQIVRIYALNVDDLIELARLRVNRPFSTEECIQYLLHWEKCPALP